jgi:crotonobetainyl-CoA hydratase
VSDELLLDTEGPVRVLTLNRPHVRNAISSTLGAALHTAIVAADNDPDIRCIVITGAGDLAFCAGGDLKEMAGKGGPDMAGDARVITRALRYRPAKPLLAAVNGLAFGGGLELVLACDLALSAAHATFALPEVRRGVLASGGGLVNLPRLVGPRRALQVILTGAPIDATTALDWGLVNEVVPSGTELAATLALAHTIADNAPLSVRFSKKTAIAALTASRHDAWRLNDAAYRAVCRSPDALEGSRAFAERRAPVWTGDQDGSETS